MVDPISASGGVVQTVLNFYFIYVYLQKYPNFTDIERSGSPAPIAVSDFDVPPPPPPKIVVTAVEIGAINDQGLQAAEEGAAVRPVAVREPEEDPAPAPVAKELFVLEEEEE